MTSSSALLEGDRVAVSRNGDWRFFKLGVVLRVLGSGARVRLDDAKATEWRGVDMHSSCVRFAYEEDGRWVADRVRRQAPTEVNRQEREETEKMPEATEGPSAAATLLEKIRAAGLTWEEIEAAVAEAKAADLMRRRMAEVEEAQGIAEGALAEMALAEGERDRAEKEMAAAREMYDASVAAFEAATGRVTESRARAEEAKRRVASLTEKGQRT